METKILNNIADKIPDTSNPGTIFEASNTNKALITKKNNPRVRIVIGNVKITKIGLTKTFKTPKTIATNKAVIQVSIETPGIK